MARLVADIRTGRLGPGARLATEQALTEALGVSRAVVREAVAALRADGLIVTRRGSGAYVADPAAAPTFLADIAFAADGKGLFLVGQGDRLVGSGPRGNIDLPIGTMNDLSWWNEGIVKATRVLDAQNGGTNPVRATGPVTETIDAAGRRIEASRYDVTMGSKHSGATWYDREGRWVKTLLITKGEELDYRFAA